MKTLIGMLVAAMLVAAPAYGVVLVSDNFDYAAGASLLDNGWVKSWPGSAVVYASDLEVIDQGNAARFVESGNAGQVKVNDAGRATIPAGMMVRLTGYLDPGDHANGGASKLATVDNSANWDQQYLEIEYVDSSVDRIKAKYITTGVVYSTDFDGLGLNGTPIWATIEMSPDFGARFYYQLPNKNRVLYHEDAGAPNGGATVEGLRIFGFNAPASAVGYPGSALDPAIDTVLLELIPTQPVPEPATLGLLAIGAVSLLKRRRR